jgi:cytochrome c-type biogenesis protein
VVAVAGPLAISADPLGILVAFGAGMLSFLSPCVLPLVPAYVSMVSGISANEIGTAPKTRPSVLPGVLGFIVGFTVVFVILGAGASWLGHLLLDHQRTLLIPAGAVIVVLGLWLAGVGTPRLFMQERRFHPRPSRLGVWAPPVMGMAFAFGWTPCIGPVLGAVLGLAYSRATLGSGIVLLVAYSLGLGVPFLVTGLAFGHLTGLLARVRRRLGVLNALAGILLVAFGVVLLTDNLHWLATAVTDALRAVGLGRLTVS